MTQITSKIPLKVGDEFMVDGPKDCRGLVFTVKNLTEGAEADNPIFSTTVRPTTDQRVSVPDLWFWPTRALLYHVKRGELMVSKT